METIKINDTTLNFPAIIYVDVALGDDEGTGLKDSPVQTISKAIELCPIDGAIKLNKGVYSIYKFSDLVTSGKNLTVIGENKDTVIEVKHVPQIETIIEKKLIVYNCIFRMSETSTGDRRMMLYINVNSKPVFRFYNVAFIKNTNRPSEGFFTWSNTISSHLYRDVVFSNCASVNSYLSYNVTTISGIEYVNCATNMNGIANRYNGGNIEHTCLFKVIFNEDYGIVNTIWENIGTGLNPDETPANIGLYGGLFAWGFWEFLKYLVKHDDKIKTLANGDWMNTELTEPLTKTNFEEFGFTNLDLLLDKDLSDLELLISDDDKNNLKIIVKAIPNSQLVLPKGDIILTQINNIVNFKLYTVSNTSENLKIVFSVDGGVSWQVYDNTLNKFKKIDIQNLLEINNEGMDINTFNSIGLRWNRVVTENKIRFGYFLKIEQKDDITNVDKLELTMDVLGNWESILHEIDYDYEYDNERIYIELYRNGSYKINYI